MRLSALAAGRQAATRNGARHLGQGKSLPTIEAAAYENAEQEAHQTSRDTGDSKRAGRA